MTTHMQSNQSEPQKGTMEEVELDFPHQDDNYWLMIDVSGIKVRQYPSPLEVKMLIHHQLQKARQDWLRDEIVKLEGMKKKTDYPVSYDTNEGRKWTAMRDNHAGFNTCLDVLKSRYQADQDQPTEDKKYCNGEPCICGETNTNQLKV